MADHRPVTADPVHDDSWRDGALCRQVDPELWFPEKGANGADAKRVCQRCPVRADCLEFALTTGQNDGIWAGHNERDLRKLRSARGLTRPVQRISADRVCALAAEGWSYLQIAEEVGCHRTSVEKILRRKETAA